jgi:putative oxidoreductase
MLRDLAVLVVRVTVGGLLAGHGSQKLFGWFGGHGLAGTGGWFEGMGFRPGQRWASIAAASELGGGLMTALGFLNPIGPLAAMGSMLVATLKAHAGRPIWVTEGGAELPVTNLAVLSAVAIAGPGRLSVDRLIGRRLPRWTLIPGAAIVGGLTWFAITHSERTLRASASAAPDESEPEVTAPHRLEVVRDAGAGADDSPVAPEPASDVVVEPLGNDAVAAVTRATPDAPTTEHRPAAGGDIAAG